ncbi:MULTISPECIES: sigma-54 dependent transcriptional regulator [unclassified Rhizobacter]|uniref:sigma-54-dependent transcriptional regulator n=1 Tax=unclassified Rhizobacter TaxID=2640088 RepID=UPI0006FD9ADC|nr:MULTISPECIES: sigma-54 dependent transcriptional regulator [unclassified Rhizobacter]KQU67233.1 Fis family transcriptional regulator [Rhizobacter sp. Root29]KQW14623.1 Fis family transcriptional regulator [Rhizobacter sp. Root1238]KRB23978.1 Fis family transcriptional regulator [Rhizobacter sp. Root16D2]
MSSPSHFSLLVVDDEPDLRTLYELTLLREGYDVETAGTVDDALLHLKDRTYSAVITDMRLPDGTGLDLLRRLEEGNRREKAIVITAYGSAENAVEALKAGAYDYLTKPVDLKQFRAVVASALGRSAATVPTMVPSSLPSENGGAGASSGPSAARPVAPAPAAPPVQAGPVSQALMRMAGQSQAMQQVRQLIDKVARSMAPVLVNGESGTGKELVARAIHEISPRTGQPFVPVNCSAIPEQLLEAEFFGYRKGAFTGAAEDREGFFQAANGGTLFLDEIGDLPLAMQSKLLRAIQERSVRPVGAVVEQAVNVRLLSATHKDLGAEVQAGKFRQDLYYRLNVIQIRVPPLRERLEDLPSICDRVLDRIARDAGVSPAPRLTRDAMVQLSRYSFPGNVRELENLLHRAVALTVGDVIDVADLGVSELVFSDSEASEFDASPVVSAKPVAAAAVAEAARAPAAPVQAPLPSDLAAYLDDIERDVLERALERYRYNRTAAGASLGLSLRQMRYRMARLGVNVGGTDDPVDVERGEPG